MANVTLPGMQAALLSLMTTCRSARKARKWGWRFIPLEPHPRGKLGKGKASKGKDKGKKGLLALKDKEEEPEGEREEDTLEEALKKARKARDSVAKTQNDLEEALEKAKDKLSRQGNATATGLGTELGKVLTQLKAVLEGKKKKPQ